jgi:hypothetical protein
MPSSKEEEQKHARKRFVCKRETVIRIAQFVVAAVFMILFLILALTISGWFLIGAVLAPILAFVIGTFAYTSLNRNTKAHDRVDCDNERLS